MMRRRELLTLLGSAALGSPPRARAQQPTFPVIGFLRRTTADDAKPLVAATNKGLNETGFIEGRNLAIEYRLAENRNDRLPTLAADLVQRQVAVIVASGNEAALAAKAATTTIPIVFATANDPLKIGLVASMNRPDANLTGASFLSLATAGKRLELLHQLVPGAAVIAFLADPNDNPAPETESERRQVQAAAQNFGLRLLELTASNEHDIETAFQTLVQQRAGALFVGSGAFLNSLTEKIFTLAARHAIPACYAQPAKAAGGGLMSYGADILDAYRQVGLYVGRLLKGAKPADLPVMLPVRFPLIINLKTAKALGLEVPPKLLALADEVIE